MHPSIEHTVANPPLEYRQLGQTSLQVSVVSFGASQLSLKLNFDHPGISTTLVGMSTRKHVDDNLRALELAIDPALLATIQEIVRPVHNYVWSSGRIENHG